MLWHILSLIVRKHAVFLREKSDGISRETELHFFAVYFHLRFWKRGFKTVGCPFVVGAENQRVVAVHFEAQLVVALANLLEFLMDFGLDHPIVTAFLGRRDFRLQPQLFVV